MSINFRMTERGQGGTPKLELNDTRREIAFERESLAQWLQESRHIESSRTALFSQLLQLLNPIFEYIAAAPDPISQALRLWCVLYLARPDLIEQESMDSAAVRFGVSPQVIRSYLGKFLAGVPHYRYVPKAKVGPNSLEGRRRIQRRAALLKAGAVLDRPRAEMDAEIERARAAAYLKKPQTLVLAEIDLARSAELHEGPCGRKRKRVAKEAA